MLGEAGPQTFPYHWGEAVETTNPFSHSKKGHFRTVLSYKNKREAEREAERGLQSALMEADKRAAVIEMFTNIIEAIRPERGGL